MLQNFSLLLLCNAYVVCRAFISYFIGMVSYCMLTFQGPEELFETISQALLSSVDRDCLSGWGGHVYVV